MHAPSAAWISTKCSRTLKILFIPFILNEQFVNAIGIKEETKKTVIFAEFEKKLVLSKVQNWLQL